MTTRTALPAVAYDRVRVGRRLAFVFAIAVCATGLGVAAPTALGQTASVEPGAEYDTLGADSCIGPANPEGSAPFIRTELYFGSNKPDGTVVTEAQFQQFLDREITPRFPDGLTLLTGIGQFRGANGIIQRERSTLLILLYPRDTAETSAQKIEEIRTSYKYAFQQESVLRADEPQPECISF